jgi:predicted metal-binding membrane protein
MAVTGSVVVIAILAWWVLVRHADGMHVWYPHATSLSVGSFVLTILMWLVMTVGMMLPAALPWILMFAESNRATGNDTARFSVVWFVTGYLVIWAAYSAVAGSVQLMLQQSSLLQDGALRLGTIGGGIVLLGAGLFQFTPLKQACLEHCRSPLSFFLSRWDDGPVGVFHMGFRHGLFCLGCCWALMALGFALGVMNLFWMAVLTLVVLGEKILPRGELLARSVGVALVVWGMRLVVGS